MVDRYEGRKYEEGRVVTCEKYDTDNNNEGIPDLYSSIFPHTPAQIKVYFTDEGIRRSEARSISKKNVPW